MASGSVFAGQNRPAAMASSTGLAKFSTSSACVPWFRLGHWKRSASETAYSQVGSQGRSPRASLTLEATLTFQFRCVVFPVGEVVIELMIVP